MSPTDEALPIPMACGLPKWSPEEKALWLDLMEAYSTALLPTEEDLLSKSAEFKERKAVEAVALGAKLADVAVQEFQYRQFAQASPEREHDAARGFEQFAAWLTRNRTPRREKKKTTAARRKY
jgi:hypothetical protein